MIGLRRGTVQLADYDPDWPVEFEKEKRLLERAFGDRVVAIEHVGSTAVPGLSAKPIIDIEIGLRHFEDWHGLVPLAEKAGYSFMPERVFEDYVFMPKGAEDCRTHYLHFAAVDSSEWQHVIRFRDALRRDQKLRDEYAALKRHLSETHQNRAEYTQAKTAFIEKALEAK